LLSVERRFLRIILNRIKQAVPWFGKPMPHEAGSISQVLFYKKEPCFSTELWNSRIQEFRNS